MNEASETLSAAAQRLAAALDDVVVGQRGAIETLVVVYLAGGHALLEGVPGLGKTLLARAFAAASGQRFGRVQFTPDLMPADLLGTNVYDAATGTFRLVRGPVFCEVLMADEINRTPPKTQSALLEAMQERQVTIDGVALPLPADFFVVATQNPIEFEGVYPLPEAQLDRFLLQVDVGYPDQGAERRMLFATTGTDERRVEAILTSQELQAIQRLVRQLPVPDKVVEAILKLARSARPGTGMGGDTDRLIAWGPGPRASQALMLAVRAKALIDGRLAPSVDDVISLAEPVLKHRMALTFAARAEGETATSVINRLAAALE